MTAPVTSRGPPCACDAAPDEQRTARGRRHRRVLGHRRPGSRAAWPSGGCGASCSPAARSGCASSRRRSAGEAEPCDVADRAAVDRVAARVLERHPRVHVLVNNAGSPRPLRLPRGRSGCDRGRRAHQLPRRGLVPASLPARPSRGGARRRRQRRLRRGRGRLPALRALLGVEARPARVLARDRGPAARRADPRAHGQARVRRDRGLSAVVAARPGAAARARAPRTSRPTCSPRWSAAEARRRCPGTTPRPGFCRRCCRTPSPGCLPMGPSRSRIDWNR